MMYFTTWTDPVSIYLIYQPVTTLLKCSLFFPLFRNFERFRQELSRDPCWVLFYIFLSMVVYHAQDVITSPLLWHKAVQWGMNSCINLSFWFIFCDFFLSLLFPICMMRLIPSSEYDCHNIEITIWQISTPQHEPWSEVRLFWALQRQIKWFRCCFFQLAHIRGKSPATQVIQPKQLWK